jgi:hypothetical protein
MNFHTRSAMTPSNVDVRQFPICDEAAHGAPATSEFLGRFSQIQQQRVVAYIFTHTQPRTNRMTLELGHKPTGSSRG